MRVCHIWHFFHPIEFGGVERYILSLSDFMSKHDQNMHFIMVTDKAAYVPLMRSLRISRCQKINSLEVHRLGPNLASVLKSVSCKLFYEPPKIFDSMLTANLYMEALRVKGIDEVDIFHVHGFWQSLYPTVGLLLSQHFNRPFVVTLHGDSVDRSNPYSMPLTAQPTLDVLRRAHAITTYSQETFDLLHKLGLNKTTWLIPNFVDTQSFKRPLLSNNGSGKRVVMVTRLSKPKDPITAIRAFAKVRKEQPEATFKIVGYGPLFKYANLLIQDLNLDEAVTLVGLKSDVRKFLWDSDIAIGTKGSYLTTLEAWAAGLAVIAPDLGIMKEIISNGENGLLVPPGDTNQLASAILRLMQNKDLLTNIATNGELTVKKHDIRTVASSIANIYDRCIKQASENLSQNG
jgi:glycosyltransferase involved in cell wall biosynthesis